MVWSRGGEDRSAVQRVFEHGIQYEVDPLGGQKTGFFLDQRDNRKLLMETVGDRPVLNAFSYTGGFSLAALRGGSPHVISLDASGPAIAAANRHAEINGYTDRHEGVQGDVMAYLRQIEVLPPVVVLDPPAYAKSRSNRHKAVQGYKRLNAMAIKKMPEHGILWTFSCSQVVDTALFEDTVVAAALTSGRTVRILRRLGQPADHPTKAGHPEAQYLKGLILHVH
jgi:23S rRNA (cytosine1962-C5)-methyltransferase